MNDQFPAGTANTPTPLCPIPRSGISRTSGVILSVLLTLALALCGLTVGALRTTSLLEFQIAEYASAAIGLLLLIHLWRVCRTARGIVPLLAVAAFLLYGLTGSLIPAGLIVALVFAIAEGSVMIALLPRDKLALLPLIPILAYAAAAAVSRDLIGSVTVLAPVPAAIALAIGTRQSAQREDGPTRVGVICSTTLALGLTLAALIALALYRFLGTLQPDALIAALDTLREAYIVEITSFELPAGATDAMKQFFTRESAENTVNSIINLLPSIAVVAVLILSTVAQLIQHAALIAFGHKDSLSDRVRAFRISLIACLVFVASYTVAIFSSSGSSTLAGTVAENIYIILLPGLALAGLIRIVGGLTRKGAGGMGCMFYLVLLAPCLLVVAPALLAIIEVIAHIFTAIMSRIKPPSED